MSIFDEPFNFASEPYAYFVMRKNEIWRGPWTEEQALFFVKEAEEDGFRSGFFTVSRMALGSIIPYSE